MRFETERLILRQWEARDRAPYAALAVAPEMRRYSASIPTEAQVHGWMDGWQERIEEIGFDWFAIERKSDGELLGDAGLRRVDEETQAAMTRPGELEIGWAIAHPWWGHGYATEAAAACLALAWRLGFGEVVAFTQAQNAASERVMQKLGMTRDAQHQFEDPTVPAGHWQRPTLIYRIANPAVVTPGVRR